jgi:1,4-alpha-glucan branching enzyme
MIQTNRRAGSMILKDYFEGNTFDAYRYFGAHWTGNGFVFRTCAPGAEALAVKGDFSGWKEIPMERRDKRGIWSLTVPEACPGQRYQYVIRGTLRPIVILSVLLWSFGLENVLSFRNPSDIVSRINAGCGAEVSALTDL